MEEDGEALDGEALDGEALDVEAADSSSMFKDVDTLDVEAADSSSMMEDSDAFLFLLGSHITPPLEISLDISKWRSSSKTLS